MNHIWPLSKRLRESALGKDEASYTVSTLSILRSTGKAEIDGGRTGSLRPSICEGIFRHNSDLLDVDEIWEKGPYPMSDREVRTSFNQLFAVRQRDVCSKHESR
jgi:hypothetical protein